MTGEPPRISIVVPLYNKAAYIGDTIAALANQAPPPAELIIVDDASTDDSVERCRQALTEFAKPLSETRQQLILSERNSGPSHARNRGLQDATGDWIGFQDADDCYTPGALNRIRRAIRACDPTMLVLGYQSDPAGEHFPDLAALEGECAALECGLQQLRTPLLTVTGPDFFMGRASNVMIRREHLRGLWFDETATLNEGIDFWYRVLRSVLATTPDARIGLLTEPMIRFRILPDSLSHQARHRWQDLPPPPSIARYLDSTDPFDQRLIRTLAARWTEYADWSLKDASEQRAFFAAHATLLQRVALRASSRGEA
ncbi:glycosyltransferase family 2 protein [Ahniella affigens]|nr:glycosyltransferase family A protein [Ahniella affigens]